jgi:hypothetical protein
MRKGRGMNLYSFARVLACVGFVFGIALSNPARAEFVLDFEQVGANVVVTGSGTIDISGLGTPVQIGLTNFPLEEIQPNAAWYIQAGVPVQASVKAFQMSGPKSFGTGGTVSASSWTGSEFFIQEGRQFAVPGNYQSGASLTTGETFDSTTISALGLTPGTYTYTFGSGADADSIVVEIAAAVPEPSTWAMMILGFCGLGLMAYRRKQNGSALSVA